MYFPMHPELRQCTVILLPVNFYIALNCIIAGALSMFSARGCVPDWVVVPNTLPRGVLDNVMSVDHIVRYHPCCKLQVNIKKYIPIVR